MQRTESQCSKVRSGVPQERMWGEAVEGPAKATHKYLSPQGLKILPGFQQGRFSAPDGAFQNLHHPLEAPWTLSS